MAPALYVEQVEGFIAWLKPNPRSVTMFTFVAMALLQQTSPASIVVRPAAPRVMAGDTLRLTAELRDASGARINSARFRFQYAAGDRQAGIDSTGLITATVPGTVKAAIVALVEGRAPVVKTVDVTITPGRAARVELGSQPGALLVGGRVRLVAAAFSAGNDPAADSIVWTSSAPNVARVGQGGVLLAVATGRADITARAGSARATFGVTVRSADVASVEVQPSVRSGRQGDVVKLVAIVKDRSGRAIPGLTPQWTMSGGAGVIDQDGTFVGYDASTYTVTANFGQRSADATLTLSERDVKRQTKLVGSVVRSAFSTSEVWVHPNGKVAYLGTLGDRLYALDISNPANPAIVDSVVANTRHVNDIMSTADGKYLVFTRENADNRRNGIVICSLEDPLHPKPLSEFTDGVTAGVHSAFVYTQPQYGTHIYLTNDGTGAIHVIDINDPVHPKQASTWKTPRADAGRSLHDIDVQNGLLYASYWNDGLVILDVGNGIKGGTPSSPQFVSQYKYDLDKMYRDLSAVDPTGYIRGTHTAWRHGKYVIIADEVFAQADIQAVLSKRIGRAYGNLQVIDVSDVTKPRAVAWYSPEYGGVHNIWAAGDTLYVGAYNGGFRAFDIGGELRGDLKAQGREIANYMTSSPNGAVPNAPMTWGAVVKNNLIFVNDFNAGLFILRLEPRQQVVP